MKTNLTITFLLIIQICIGQNFTGFTLNADQDFFIPDRFDLNNDQNYTQGLFLSFNGKFSEYIYPISKPRQFLDKTFKLDTLNFLHFYKGSRSNTYSFSLGGTGFTPLDIGTPEIIIDDRPYASFLLFSSQRISLRQPKKPKSNSSWKVITSDFTINILGLPFAESMQTKIHEGKLKNDPNGRPLPLGWSNQISDGGEPSLLYRVNLSQKIFDFFVDANSDGANKKADYHIFQMTHNAGFGLGYYTYMSTGVSMRLGLMRTKIFLKNIGLNGMAGIGNKNLNQFKKLITEAEDDKKEQHKKDRRKAIWSQFEAYLFFSSNTTVFLYNAGLSGQFRKSAYRMPHSQINPLIFTYEAGIAFNLGYVNLGYVLISRSPEFYGPKSRSHTWGSIYFSIQKPLEI